MAKTSKTLLILGTLFTLVSCSAKRWLSVTTEVFQSSYEDSEPTIEEKAKTIIARYESSYERKHTKESVFETADMSSYVSDVDYVNCRVRMQCHSYGYT